jgi:hypothetical protein
MGAIRVVEVVPTVTVGAYSAGDAVGDGLEFEDVVSSFAPEGEIMGLILIDKAQQDKEMDLWLFDRAFTATDDNAEFDPSDADIDNCIGVIHIATTDYIDAKDQGLAWVVPEPKAFRLEDQQTSLFAQLVTAGTPTFAAVDDLTLKLIVSQ